MYAMLHWLMFLLIVAVYACIELRSFYPKESDARALLKTWHFMLGLFVFALAGLRLAIHVTQIAPRIEPPPGPKLALLAKLAHVALYVFMLGMPLAGWLILSAAGKSIPFFGLDLPALIVKNVDRAHFIKDVHEVGGTIGYSLIGIHTAAALFHHYVTRDNTFLRMLPARRSARPAKPPRR